MTKEDISEVQEEAGTSMSPKDRPAQLVACFVLEIDGNHYLLIHYLSSYLCLLGLIYMIILDLSQFGNLSREHSRLIQNFVGEDCGVFGVGEVCVRIAMG